jgi:adenylate cyclase class IV
MQTFEVEVKSLLGSEENAQVLRERMKQVDSATTLTSRNTQLNHYFSSAEPQNICAAVEQYFSEEHTKKLYEIFEKGKEFSIRTRDKDGKVFLVVKASVDNTTSSNGITRMEFEEEMPLTLDELDQVLLSAGCAYQAKWSREREEYLCRGVAVTLDKNAGYGWLAEFERVVKDESQLDAARKEVRALMEQCGVQELQQDRLERMFAFYNAHWGEYYGTEKVFTIA